MLYDNKRTRGQTYKVIFSEALPLQIYFISTIFLQSEAMASLAKRTRNFIRFGKRSGGEAEDEEGAPGEAVTKRGAGPKRVSNFIRFGKRSSEPVR